MTTKEMVKSWNDGQDRLIIIYEDDIENVLFENSEKVFLNSPFTKNTVKEWLVYHDDFNNLAVLEMGI